MLRFLRHFSYLNFSKIQNIICIFSLLLSAGSRCWAAEGDITTVAGGWFGDNGPATSAVLYNPVSVVFDSFGNLYIADRDNFVIRKVDTSGMISTIAGNGSIGYSGDNGPATSASLSSPSGIAVDAAGNIYVADIYNHVIRKVDTSGMISTIAGNGSDGYSGDNGPATSASLSYPSGTAVDAAGNIYIADTSNHVIRKVSPSGIITTVAGNGTYDYSGDGGAAISATLKMPAAIALDSSNNIYISDSGSYVVRKVDVSGTITTVAGNGTSGYSGDNGPAISAALKNVCDVCAPDYISGIAVDNAGSIYIADTGNSVIRKVDPSGTITTVAGNGTSGYSGDNGPAISGSLNRPLGVAVVPGGGVYIADSYNSVIRQVDMNGTIATTVGSQIRGYYGNNGPATSAALYHPGHIAFDASGNLFIADGYNLAIRKVTPSGEITTVAGNGTWGYSGDNGPATSASLTNTFGVAADSSGNIYITDYINGVIRKVDSSGIITTIAGGGTFSDHDYIGPATSAQLWPVSVALDADGNLYIADSSTIRKVDTSGMMTTIAGGGHLVILTTSGRPHPQTSPRPGALPWTLMEISILQIPKTVLYVRSTHQV